MPKKGPPNFLIKKKERSPLNTAAMKHRFYYLCNNVTNAENSLKPVFVLESESESESKSDFVSRWIHRESKLIFALSSEKDQREKFALPFAFA